jgi:hypothetical protein
MVQATPSIASPENDLCYHKEGGGSKGESSEVGGLVEATTLSKPFGTGLLGWVRTNMHIIYTLKQLKNKIMVMSFGDWGWALSLWQLGAAEVRCLPLNQEASKLLKNLMQVVPGLTAVTEPHGEQLMAAHVTDVAQVNVLNLLCPGGARRVFVSCPLGVNCSMGALLRQRSAAGVRK